MVQFVNRVIKDIKSKQNIDVYIVSFFAIGFAILTLAGDLPATLFGEKMANQINTSFMLAALGLLVLNISIPKSKASQLDDYLDDRSNLGSFSERIRNATKLYIYAPSAANILRGDNADAIRKSIFAKKDGELRVIIQNPDKQGAVDILVDQLDNSIDFQVQYLADELQNTLKQFKLIQSWNVDGTFQFKLLDYSPGFSLVLIDPHKNDGQIIVEIHGLHNESTDSRMNIVITKKESERWFTYWHRQFERMWQKSQEIEEAVPSN
jgi:hypothetical protein